MSIQVPAKVLDYVPSSRDAVVLYREICGEKTRTCVLDNRKGPTPKTVIVTMKCTNGKTKTLVEDYLPANELGLVDLTSLECAVSEFEIRWWLVGETIAHCNGVCAVPPGYFPFFGIAWDEHDVAHLILPEQT